MEVITIESKAYQDMLSKIDALYGHLRVITEIRDKAEIESKNIWMDSKSVCNFLNISQRTLFRMKKEGRIKYSIFRGHSRYQKSDVEQIRENRNLRNRLSGSESTNNESNQI